MELLNEAAQQRNLYSIGSTVSRRVAAAAATAVCISFLNPLIVSLFHCLFTAYWWSLMIMKTLAFTHFEFSTDGFSGTTTESESYKFSAPSETLATKAFGIVLMLSGSASVILAFWNSFSDLDWGFRSIFVLQDRVKIWFLESGKGGMFARVLFEKSIATWPFKSKLLCDDQDTRNRNLIDQFSNHSFAALWIQERAFMVLYVVMKRISGRFFQWERAHL